VGAGQFLSPRRRFFGKIKCMKRKIQKRNDKDYLRIAIAQAKESVKKGGFPAGAIVVKNGKVVSRGISLTERFNDPTNHAEISAIRKAYKILKTVKLKGAVLYASLQPCLMCFSVANWADISKIVFGCKKAVQMISKGYYEGATDIYRINKENNRQIKLVYIPDFEKLSLKLINYWENKRKK